MTIYFVGSISGKDKFQKNYEAIVSFLKKNGHEVLDQTTNVSKQDVYNFSEGKKVEQYQKIKSWISRADLIVVEISNPSIGLGHEISIALEKGKPVIALYCVGDPGHFIEGNNSEKLLVVKYDLLNLTEVIGNALDFVISHQDSRFNLMLPPEIVQHLNQVSEQKHIPKSVYIRDLIISDMNKDHKFSA